MNKKISRTLGILVILIVAIVTSIVIYLTGKTETINTDTEPKTTAATSQVKNETNNWNIYKNSELGISFSYPDIWGEVKEEIFDSSGKSEYFKFSNLKNSQLGGLHKGYFDNGIGRGGSLMDYDGFAEESLLKDYGDNGKTTWDNDDYQANSSNVCAYSTHKLWFDGYIYHAVCNLKNNKVSGFNFAFGTNVELPEISKKEFIKLIESVKVDE
ncbi:hypothetical protein HOB25_00955 [bacterium]|jgi:hypothetical protein|nr:hypothetical protein [bacterium]